eukprot:SAG31_NODE_316_length_17841_cov_33.716154_7_plen_496_part_00
MNPRRRPGYSSYVFCFVFDSHTLYDLQYPDARWQFTADLRCLETLVSMAAPESLPAFEEFSRQFMVELDYKAERGHIEEIHRTVMRRFSHVVAVPEVIPERCTDSVLTMTYLPGPTLDTEVRRQQAAAGLPADPVRAAGGIRAMLQQDGNHHHHLAGNDSSSDCQDTVHDSSGTALTGEPRNRSGWLLKLALGVVSVVGVDTGFAVLRQSRQLAAGCRWLFAQLVVFFLCPFKSNADLNLAQTSTEESRWIGWALAELQRQKAAEVVGQAENWLKTLFEVHGYCVLSPESSGLFNADPHPGNLIAMPDGRIGLIDFGQCKRVSQADRRLLADLLLAVKMRDEAGTAAAFRAAGMQTKNDSDFFLGRFGRLLFGKLEPQMMERSWHHELHKRDRIVQFPTDLLMVYRMVRKATNHILARSDTMSLFTLHGMLTAGDPPTRTWAFPTLQHVCCARVGEIRNAAKPIVTSTFVGDRCGGRSISTFVHNERRGSLIYLQ